MAPVATALPAYRCNGRTNSWELPGGTIGCLFNSGTVVQHLLVRVADDVRNGTTLQIVCFDWCHLGKRLLQRVVQ